MSKKYVFRKCAGWMAALCCAYASLGPAAAREAGPDPDFGRMGMVSFDLGRKNTEAGGLVVQADGRILIGGVVDGNIAVVRCLPSGEADRSFGTGGVVSFDCGGKGSLSALAQCGDGSIVAGGVFVPPGESGKRIALIRFGQDGALDTGYGNGGVVSTRFQGRSKLNALIPTQDGGVLIAGYDSATAPRRAMIARYDRSGTPDAAFGTNGVVHSDRGNSEYRSLTLMKDGGVLACGSVKDARLNANALAARYDSVGTPLFAFADSGTLEKDLGGKGDQFRRGIELEDGSLFFAGESDRGNPKKAAVALFQTLPNGMPDGRFGDGGMKIVAFGGLEAVAVDALPLEDDSLLVAGYCGGSKLPGKYDLLLLRCLGDGAMFGDFGTDGVLSVDLGADDRICAVARGANDKVFVAANSGKYGFSKNELHAVLTRYTVTAQPDAPFRPGLDPAFGRRGLVRTDFGGDDKPNDMIAFPDGGVLVVGSSEEPAAQPAQPDVSRIVMARYKASGDLDPAFGTGGKGRAERGTQAYAYRALPVPGGGGGYYVGGAVDNQMALFRFRPDGTPDAAFGNAGASIVPTPYRCWGRAMALQADGRILLAGRMELGQLIHRVALCRILPSGEPDPAFGENGVAITDVGERRLAIRSLAVRSDGSILVFGHASTRNHTDRDIFVARYTPDGKLDRTFFKGRGYRFLNRGGDEYVNAVILRNDGTFILGGSGGPNGDLMLVCLDAEGDVRASFGEGGHRFFRPGEGTSGRLYGRALALLPDGRIFLAGDDAGDHVMAVCVRPDGTPDASFGQDGSIRTDLGTYSGSMAAATADGHLLLGGFSRGDFFVARYVGPSRSQPDVPRAPGTPSDPAAPRKPGPAPQPRPDVPQEPENPHRPDAPSDPSDPTEPVPPGDRKPSETGGGCSAGWGALFGLLPLPSFLILRDRNQRRRLR